MNLRAAFLTVLIFLGMFLPNTEAGIKRAKISISFVVESKEELTNKVAKMVIFLGGDENTKFDLSTRDETRNGISFTLVTLTIKQ